MLLLLSGAHFAVTYNVPAPAGHAWPGWPFATGDAGPFGIVGGRSGGRGSAWAGVAALTAACFVMATLAVVALWVPSVWWRPLALAGAVASLALMTGFFTVDKLPAIAVDLAVIAVATTGCVVP